MRLIITALILMNTVSVGPALACQSPPTVFFDLNSTALSPAGTSALSEFALQQSAAWQDIEAVIVVGHSDRTGSRDKRNRIGAARASAVRDTLMAFGVPSGLIRTKSAADRQPALVTPDQVADPRNRRVELRIIWTKAAQTTAAARRDEAIKTGALIPIC